jgi:hypothetical protein
MFGEDLRWWQRILLLLLCLTLVAVIVVIVLLIVVLVRTAANTVPAFDHGVVEAWSDGKHMERAQRLAGAIKLQTVSSDSKESAQNLTAILEFHKYLQNSKF